MKDQYFGDINDYRKYGILRALQSKGQGTLLVAWMLTPDDGSRDGESRSYLEDPATWKRYDPELFASLGSLVRSAPAPKVSLMEKAGLLPNTLYYSKVVPNKRDLRDAWRCGLLDGARNADLVFVDPDNGIEVPSKPIGCWGSSKYVAWQEIQALWQGGCSILIYQHFPREPREDFAKRMVSELKKRTGAGFTEAFHTPTSYSCWPPKSGNNLESETRFSFFNNGGPAKLTQWGWLTSRCSRPPPAAAELGR